MEVVFGFSYHRIRALWSCKVTSCPLEINGILLLTSAEPGVLSHDSGEPGLKRMGLNPFLIYSDTSPALVYFNPHSEERKRSQLCYPSTAQAQFLLGNTLILCSSCVLFDTPAVSCVMSPAPSVSTVSVLIKWEVSPTVHAPECVPRARRGKSLAVSFVVQRLHLYKGALDIENSL